MTNDQATEHASHLVLPHGHVAPEDVPVLVPDDGHGPGEVQAVAVHVMLHVVSTEQLLVVAHSESNDDGNDVRFQKRISGLSF